MKDLARATGLGLATISKYINGGNVLEKNKIAIDKAIVELGFTVNEFARGLKTKRSKTIGIVIPELSNVFITSILTVVGDILRSNGYGTLVCDCRTDVAREREAVEFLLSKQVDGIINMPVSRTGEHMLPAVQKSIPVVLLDRMIPELKDRVNAVLVNNTEASAMATNLLLEAGHTNIGIILGPQNIFTSQQRLLGYTQSLIENSLCPEQDNIIYADYSVEGGYEGMKQLLQKELTAVFVTNYEMTLGAIMAINELGINIPNDISFIGFDNQQLAKVIKPKLTIVTQPLTEIGKQAANILLRRLSGKEAADPETIVLSTKIEEGDSIK